MAHHRHEPRVWSPVRVPAPADEDARRTHRERQNLLKERGRHVNRIKGLCAQQGIQGYEPIRRDRRERLARLVTGDGRPLPPRLRAEIDRELRRLELVLEQIGALEAERDAAAVAEAGEEAGRAARIAALARLKGIGPEIATVLGNEVFYRRFANRRQVAAHRRLAPRPDPQGGGGAAPRLRRPGAAPVPERGIRPRPGPQPGRQPARPDGGRGARLAVAAPPAREPAERLARAAGRGPEGSGQADHGGGPGAEAAARAVALPRGRPGARGRGAQGLTGPPARPRRRGRRVTAGIQGFECRRTRRVPSLRLPPPPA